MEHKYIDADELMEKLDDLRPANLNTLYAVENIICEMPAADVEPVRHGEWLRVKEDYTVDGARNPVYHIECSDCGYYWIEERHAKFFERCPGCGAKMDGGSEE